MRNQMEVGLFQEYPDVLEVKDLCAALRIGRIGAYKLLTTGAIQSFQIGRTYKIPKAALIAYTNQYRSKEQLEGSEK